MVSYHYIRNTEPSLQTTHAFGSHVARKNDWRYQLKNAELVDSKVVPVMSHVTSCVVRVLLILRRLLFFFTIPSRMETNGSRPVSSRYQLVLGRNITKILWLVGGGAWRELLQVLICN